MRFEIFKAALVSAVSENLPEELSKYNVETYAYKKVNANLTGLTLKNTEAEDGWSIAPVIIVEDLYEMFLQNNNDFNAAINYTVRQLVIGMKNAPKPISAKIDSDFIKNNVVFQLINREANKELLAEIPHRNYLDDLAVIYRVIISPEATTIVKDVLIKSMNLTEADLFIAASKNTLMLSQPVCEKLSTTVQDFLEELEEDEKSQIIDGVFTSNMYIISNSSRNFGASTMLFSNILHDLANKLNDDLFIIPSSIHECIAVPKREVDSIEYMLEMIYVINRTQVQPKDRLSDSLYFFNRNTGAITTIR